MSTYPSPASIPLTATAGLIATLALTHLAAADPRIVVAGELRAVPSVDATVVDKLEPGTAVPFILQRGDWLAVRHGDGVAWAHATDGVDARVATARADGCPSRGIDTIEPNAHDRVAVTASVPLRSHVGRDGARDPRLARGTRVYVHANDHHGEWVLVEDSRGQIGWVRGCELEGVADKATSGDQVVVVSAGDLVARAGGGGKTVMPLVAGDRLTIVARKRDWVQATAEDGMQGWYPADKLERRGVDEPDPSSLWQPDVIVSWSCVGARRPQEKRASRVHCGDRLRIVRANDRAKEPLLLGVTDDGRWGWVSDPVTPVAIGDAVVGDDRKPEVVAAVQTDARVIHDSAPDTVMPGMAMPAAHASGKKSSATNDTPDAAADVTERASPAAHEATMGMGMGDMGPPVDGASMSASLQTAFPVGGGMPAGTDTTMMRTPRYEVSLTASGSGQLVDGLDGGLSATFSAAQSLTADGQTRQEEYQGGQASLSVAHKLGDHAKLALAGGYALAFRSPGPMASMEWGFIATQPGPFGRLSLSGEITPGWSYSLRGTAQMATGSDGMSGSVLMADAMTMVSLSKWLTLGLNGMAMKMAMGDTMLSVGPSLSATFLTRFSASVSATAMTMSGDDMTTWTATTGVGIHF